MVSFVSVSQYCLTQIKEIPLHISHAYNQLVESKKRQATISCVAIACFMCMGTILAVRLPSEIEKNAPQYLIPLACLIWAAVVIEVLWLIDFIKSKPIVDNQYLKITCKDSGIFCSLTQEGKKIVQLHCYKPKLLPNPFYIHTNIMPSFLHLFCKLGCLSSKEKDTILGKYKKNFDSYFKPCISSSIPPHADKIAGVYNHYKEEIAAAQKQSHDEGKLLLVLVGEEHYGMTPYLGNRVLLHAAKANNIPLLLLESDATTFPLEKTQNTEARSKIQEKVAQVAKTLGAQHKLTDKPGGNNLYNSLMESGLLDPYSTDKDILAKAWNLKMGVTGVDPLHSLIGNYTLPDPNGKQTLYNTRQDAINETIGTIMQDAICMIGLAHVLPIVENQILSKKFHFFIVDTTTYLPERLADFFSNPSLNKTKDHPQYHSFTIEGNPSLLGHEEINLLIDQSCNGIVEKK